MPRGEVSPIAVNYKDNLLYARVIDDPVTALTDGQPNPEWNGRLLMTPPGTVYIVIDGVARGYPSEPLFVGVHGWRRQKEFCGGPLGHQSCRWGWINTVFYRIPTIAVIQEGPPVAADATIISNFGGGMFFFESNTVRAIGSPAIMEKYQFNWETGKHNSYSDEVFARLPLVGYFE